MQENIPIKTYKTFVFDCDGVVLDSNVVKSQAYFRVEKTLGATDAQAQALVDYHKAQGDLCVVITATNSFVTRPIANAYGIEHLIGTDPEEADGQFTGGVAGVPSFQDGKVTRLNQWLETRGQQLSDFQVSYFYSDSHNDLPLMKLVTNPIAVDADATLRAYAHEHSWPEISLR